MALVSMLRKEKPEGVRRAPPVLSLGVDSEAVTAGRCAP